MAAATSLAELAALVGGETLGDSSIPITGAWPPESARAGAITLFDCADRVKKSGDCSAAACVVPRGVDPGDRAAIVVGDVHEAFAAIVTHFRPRRVRPTSGIHPTAQIDPTARCGERLTAGPGVVVGPGVVLGDDVYLSANVVIGPDCRVGDGCYFAPRVCLYDSTEVGQRCRLHSGVVLGADGFGYRQKDGRHALVAQLGNVELGDEVEIGANTTIDRGVYGPTRIGEGTKIDNLVQIGHNCQIGRHNLLCSQVGIAGSVTTGDYVVMAGQVGVRDHVHIGTKAILSAMAGVSNDVPAEAVMLGAPATPLREQKLKFAAIAKLPELRKEFRQLKRDVAALLARFEHDTPNGESGSQSRAA